MLAVKRAGVESPSACVLADMLLLIVLSVGAGSGRRAADGPKWAWIAASRYQPVENPHKICIKSLLALYPVV